MRLILRYLYLALVILGTTSNHRAQSLWQKPKQDYTALWSAIKTSKPVKILHIGDSHINRGHTSRPIESALKGKYGEQHLTFAFHGINGATYASWSSDANLSRIQEHAPDLLIVSLGTNDSYTHNFSAETLRASMDLFLDKVKERLPKVQIVLTTPPACYLRQTRSRVVGYKKVRRRRVPIHSTSVQYTYNNNTRTAVNTIKYFGRAEGLGIIDLNAQIGTKQQAEEWLRKGWMHTDHVHYTEVGYATHGDIIARTLIEEIEQAR